MAFVLHQTWDATNPYRMGDSGASAAPALLAPLLADGRDRYAWKTGATLLSLLVHILLLWLFLTRLAGNAGESGSPAAGPSVLHTFSLSGSSASASDAPPKAAEMVAPPPAPAQQSDVDEAPRPSPRGRVERVAPAADNRAAEFAIRCHRQRRARILCRRHGRRRRQWRLRGLRSRHAGAAPLRREAARAEAPSLGERVSASSDFAPSHPAASRSTKRSSRLSAALLRTLCRADVALRS